MIYAKRLNPRQRRLLQRYEDMTGIEPMHQDDLDNGKMTFRDVWRVNVDYLYALHCDVTNFDTSGTGV